MSKQQFDSDFEEELFENANSGASQVFPRAAGDLKKGDLIVIRGRPCRVLENAVVKPGKHGHCKAHLEAVDIFTAKKQEIAAPASYPVSVPVLAKTEFLLIDIDQEDGQRLTLLDEDHNERNDLDLPFHDDESLARAIRAHFNEGREVTVVTSKAMCIEAVTAFRVCGK